jgi:hypothetical protein
MRGFACSAQLLFFLMNARIFAVSELLGGHRSIFFLPSTPVPFMRRWYGRFRCTQRNIKVLPVARSALLEQPRDAGRPCSYFPQKAVPFMRTVARKIKVGFIKRSGMGAGNPGFRSPEILQKVSRSKLNGLSTLQR